MTVKEQFEESFVRDVILNGEPINDELDELFNEVLLHEFDDNAEKMDEYISSLYVANSKLDRVSEPSSLEKAILKLIEKLDENDAKEVIELLNS